MEQTNGPTSAPLVETPSQNSNSKIKLIIIAIIGVVVLGLIWNSFKNRTVVIKDNTVPSITVAYTPLDKKLVHGEVHGKINSSASFEGRTVYFCDIVNGKIIEKGGVRYLDCPNSKVKSAAIDNTNSFTIRLTSNSYFINIPLNKGETSSDLPSRLNVHSGEAATISINIQ